MVRGFQCFSFTLMVLAGCSSHYSWHSAKTGKTSESDPVSLSSHGDVSEKDIEALGDKKVVALLLPLSGNFASLGQAMQDAAQMALYDTNSTDIVLQPLDTGNDSFVATKAAQKAADNNAKLMIGPIFSATTQAVAPIAKEHHINVISLSNDKSLAGNGVYLLGFLPSQQIQRVTEYATSRGIQNFAAIVPNDAYGTVAADTFQQVVASRGGTVNRTEYYVNNPQLKLSLERITSSVMGSMPQAEGPTPNAMLIPDGEPALTKIASYVNPEGSKHTQLLGSGQWDNAQIFSNPALQGGWFAGAEPERRHAFEQRFQATFGYAAPRLASLAYDAVALAATLAKANAEDFSDVAITNPRGFAGIDGVFRLQNNGLPERGLAVLQIEDGSVRVIDPSPKKF